MTRMSAKRLAHLRKYHASNLERVDVVHLCAHRTTRYFGNDRIIFGFVSTTSWWTAPELTKS